MLCVHYRADESRRGQYLKALVDPDEELRRNDRALDGAELRTFDLPRDRAELACRIDLGFDAASGLLFDSGRVIQARR